MILYLDASALVKRYVIERGSEQVNATTAQADLVGTVAISRAEVAAAFARAVRTEALTRAEGLKALRAFRKDWQDLVRLQVTESLVARAESLAWEHHLRGYDAVHLAAALFWQETMDAPVTMATFDERLWQSAEQVGLLVFPDDLPAWLGTRKTKRR